MKIWTKRILLFLICMGVAGCLAVVWLSAYVKSETAARILSAEEAAKQMRLRNLSGIIIIDFIDMADTAAQKEVTQRLKKAVAKDRIKTVVVGMTELGLMQVTRKKTRPSLKRQMTTKGRACDGSGRLPSIEWTVTRMRREAAR